MRVRSVTAAAVLAIATAATTAVLAQKSAGAPNAFASVKSLHCSFPTYAAVQWTAGSAPRVITNSQDLAFDFDTFDWKRRSARMVVAGGAADLVTLVATETGLNMIEQTPAGNLIITTVFASGGSGQTRLAVHSRHLGDVQGTPTPSQSYGSCDIK